MVKVGAVLRQIIDRSAPIDVPARLRALGLVPQRCCESCPFECVDGRRMVLHRVYCERFEFERLGSMVG